MSIFQSCFEKLKPTLPPVKSLVPTPPVTPNLDKNPYTLIEPKDLRVCGNCRMLVAKFEGCRLKAYQDVVGIWTIGYGQTNGVKRGMVWTQKQADDDLLTTLDEFGRGVAQLIHVPIDQNQFDALVSFTYNVGLGNFKTSTLLRKLNANDFVGAHDEFVRWNKAGGKVVLGLTHRREAEAAVFASHEESRLALEKLVNDIMMSP